MADDSRLMQVGFLNVVATPHPPGVYERLFRAVANRPVRFWGEMRAAITPIRKRRGEEGLYTGQILTWVEIDPKSPAIDKRRLEEVALDENAVRLTTSLGFNSRVFKFVFDERDHRVTFETLNEFGQSLSTRRALSIFERLFSFEVLGPDTEIVEVTIIPEDDALSIVLAIERIDRIHIIIKRPNADDVSPETLEVLNELEDENAKRQEIILSRAAQTDGLKLSERNKKYARVAAAGNGHVSAKGREADGEMELRSTKEYPKVIRVAVEAGETFLSHLVRIAERSRANRSRI